MSYTLFYDHHEGLARAFVVEGNKVRDCFFDSLKSPQQSGAITSGKVDRLMGKGAFVVLKANENSYLSGAEGLQAGDVIPVQLKGEARGAKGPPVTRGINLPGVTLIHQPFGQGAQFSRRLGDEADEAGMDGLLDMLEQKPGGWILRRAAFQAPHEKILAEAEALEKAAQNILNPAAPGTLLLPPVSAFEQAVLGYAGQGLTIVVEEGSDIAAVTGYSTKALPALLNSIKITYVKNAQDNHDLEGFFNLLCQKRVKLPQGGDVLFESGETLNAIDVNGGERRNVLEINLDAAEIIMRHLLWRNIGGAVVIDFLRMREPQDRHEVTDRVRDLAASDTLPCDIYGFTRMGLFEMSRARRGRSLAELLQKAEAT